MSGKEDALLMRHHSARLFEADAKSQPPPSQHHHYTGQRNRPVTTFGTTTNAAHVE